MTNRNGCTCDNVRKGEPYVYGRDCGHCWSWWHRPALREALGGDPAECVPVQQPPTSRPIPSCRFKGDELTGLERGALRLDHIRAWRHCLNVMQPLGPAVCECQGCGPLCSGYEVDLDEVSASSLITRFDDKTLFSDLPGKRFNASLIRWEDGFVFAWRDGWAGSQVYVCRLDNRLQPVGGAIQLHLYCKEASWGREDPRLFVFRGRLHCAFAGVIGSGGQFHHTNQLYARLAPDLQVEQIYSPQYARRNMWEKNWGFFEYENELYAVYTTTPHQILHIDGNRADLMYSTETRCPWTGGEIRGGAPPVRIGDEYYHWFHDRIGPDSGLNYRVGLAVFDAHPPFRITRITPAPVFVADMGTKPKDQYAAVAFPCGAVLTGSNWLVSMGIHDRYAEIHRFSVADVEKQLVRIAPPYWWQWRGEPQEPSMYIAIHTHDEYRVNDMDFHGKAVLDIGAHVGTFAHLAVTRGAAIVHCYEPSPETYSLLQKNTSHMGERVLAFNMAVGAAVGIGHMETTSLESTSDIVVPDFDGSVWIIGLTEAIDKLAAQSQNGRVHLLKMDCEGGEWPALARGNLTKVDRIVGEFHIRPGTPDTSWLRTRLDAAGFKVDVWESDDGRGGFFWAKRER